MLDIKYIREHGDDVRKNCRLRNVNVDIDSLLKLDADRLALLRDVQALRQERNEIAETMKTASQEQRPGLVERGKQLKQLIGVQEADLASAEEAWMNLLLQIPNRSHPDAPVGENDAMNVEVRRSAEPHSIRDVKDHVELGKSLDVLDFERGAKVTGAKFYYLKGRLAILEQALVRFALDELMGHHFVPLTTPDLAKDEVVIGTGFQPRGPESQIYSIENADLSLIGTAEITTAGYHMNEALDEDRLPLRYASLSHCYRTEAGAYGRESYGLYRVHQFTKVEMFVYATPEQSEAMHVELVRIEEDLWKKLGIPVRTVDICTGDLGGMAYRKFDLEAWMPGKSAGEKKGDWGEVTSASNCTDFQARRLGIKVRRRSGSVELLHTLNGTAIATSRALIAIMENYQQPDGSIKIPTVLVPYCGFGKIG
ncbi:serine--tRNA ligase [Candidatus Uhrbacteria bacterium RIFCSPHIGHO2_12_FULL_60_25]|uniref:Serine--tRNA ligase n=1 Tax=Candidatus Uhrbacteria bacterium RIFCSPHIGHO2_12_FULL_60_25 TaxID=1802399 RepID=A0A1F7UKB0_9BACT|nr:MAG: serine--tRNA ligase [Candidatus Uhrbacteria bacterium RIFCSPHIGHO2_02_FULL_60_44]OGL78147.1 MAG: serine--tRNA ligase [Candidatus Uhrbacteria bacterium RIFCSPHIGHO2_12_FULL_60_25]